MGINFILMPIIIIGLSLCEQISSRAVYPVAVRLHTLQSPNSLGQYSIWDQPQYDTILSSRFQFPVAGPTPYGGRPPRELVPISAARLPPRNQKPYVIAVQQRPYLMSDNESSEEVEDSQQQDYVGAAYYPDYFDYEDDDDEEEVPKKKKKKLTKIEKIEKFVDKIHNKILDKYLHIKEKKPPEPPDWAKDKFANTAPQIELPPWENYI